MRRLNNNTFFNSIVNKTRNFFFYNPEIGSKEYKRSVLIIFILVGLLNILGSIIIFSNVQITYIEDLTEEQGKLILFIFQSITAIYSFFSFPIILLYYTFLYYVTLAALGIEDKKFNEIFQQVAFSFVFILISTLSNFFFLLLESPSPVVNLGNITENITTLISLQEQKDTPIYLIKSIIERIVLIWINIKIIYSFNKNYEELTIPKSLLILIIVQGVLIIPDILVMLISDYSCIVC